MSLLSSAHTLVIPVPRHEWAPPAQGLQLDGIHLGPKSELHITVVPGRLGRELSGSLGSGMLDGPVRQVFQSLDWSYERTGRRLLLCKPTSTARHVSTAHSLIECLLMPAMADFHRHLGRWLGRELPVPPPHVTLYVAGRERGIGVASPAQLRGLCVREIHAGEIPD